MLELPRVLCTVLWKSRDFVQTVEKIWTKHIFSSRRKHILKIFSKFWFSFFYRKTSNILKHFQSLDLKNRNCRKSKGFKIFKILDFRYFVDEHFENQNFEKIFSKKIAEMKKCFWSRFFSTVWTKSLDFQKTVQSTRGSSSMPRQGISFRGCL